MNNLFTMKVKKCRKMNLWLWLKCPREGLKELEDFANLQVLFNVFLLKNSSSLFSFYVDKHTLTLVIKYNLVNRVVPCI
jgi:hypothetical protein